MLRKSQKPQSQYRIPTPVLPPPSPNRLLLPSQTNPG